MSKYADMILEYLDTDTAKELERVVRKIYTGHVGDPDMWVFCTLNDMDTEEKQKKMLKYIKDHNVTYPSDVVEISMCIDEGSEPDFKE